MCSQRGVRLSAEVLTQQYTAGEREFQNLDLFGIQLQAQILNQIDLTGSDLGETNFRKSHLTHSVLQRTNLMGASFNFALLSHSNFDYSNLMVSCFIDANLESSSLRESNLSKAILVRADLQNAKLCKANLKGTLLIEADLRGADLQRTKLETAKLQGALYNSQTHFPDDFDPEQNRMIRLLD